MTREERENLLRERPQELVKMIEDYQNACASLRRKLGQSLDLTRQEALHVHKLVHAEWQALEVERREGRALVGRVLDKLASRLRRSAAVVLCILALPLFGGCMAGRLDDASIKALVTADVQQGADIEPGADVEPQGTDASTPGTDADATDTGESDTGESDTGTDAPDTDTSEPESDAETADTSEPDVPGPDADASDTSEPDVPDVPDVPDTTGPGSYTVRGGFGSGFAHGAACTSGYCAVGSF